TNGAEALAIVERGTAFDLLFTDLIMPGRTGSQLAADIQTRRPALKVLFTSGYTEKALTHQGRLEPDLLLLTKPYRKSDMAQMVRVALDRAPSGAARNNKRALSKTRVA